MSYSQNDEESVILRYFGSEKGRFLDVGAYDGRTFSNTLALVERGWSGVCVEPEPESLAGLKQLHGKNKGITIAPMAVDVVSGTRMFYTSHGAAVSTLDYDHMVKWSADAQFDAIEVDAISPDELLETYKGPFDFFNLDVEGKNVDLLEMFPLSDMGVKLVCVEHDRQYDRILNHCACHGLNRVHYECAENLILGVR